MGGGQMGETGLNGATAVSCAAVSTGFAVLKHVRAAAHGCPPEDQWAAAELRAANPALPSASLRSGSRGGGLTKMYLAVDIAGEERWIHGRSAIDGGGAQRGGDGDLH